MREDSPAQGVMMFVLFLLAVCGIGLSLAALAQLSTLRGQLQDLRRRLGAGDASAPPVAAPPPVVPVAPLPPAQPRRSMPPPLAPSAPAAASRPPRPDPLAERLRALGLLPPDGLAGEYALGAWWAARIGALIGSASVIFLGIWLNLRSELPAWVRLSELVAVSTGLVVGGLGLGRSRPDLGRVLGAVGLAGIQFAAWASHNLPGLRVIDDPLVGRSISLLATAALVGVAVVRDSVALARATAVLGALQLLLAAGPLRDSPGAMGVLLLAVSLLGALPLALRGWITPAVLVLVGVLPSLDVLLESAGRSSDVTLQILVALAVALPIAFAVRWSRRPAVSEARGSVAVELAALLLPLTLLQLDFAGAERALGVVDGCFSLLALGLGLLSRRRGERLAEGCLLALAAAAAALGVVQYVDDAWGSMVWLVASAVCLLGAMRLELAPLRWTSEGLALLAALAFCLDRPVGLEWLCAIPLLHGLLFALRERLGFPGGWASSIPAILAMAAVIAWAGGGLDRQWHTLGWLLPLVLAWLARSPRLLAATAPWVLLVAYPSAVLGLPVSGAQRPSGGLLAVECGVFLVALVAAVRFRLAGLVGGLREGALAVVMLALVPLLAALPLDLTRHAAVPLPRSVSWLLAAALLATLLELGRRWSLGRTLDVLTIGFAVAWVGLLGEARAEPAQAWAVTGLLLSGLGLLLVGLHRARSALGWISAGFAALAVLSALPHLPGAWESLIIGLVAVMVFVAGHLGESRGERIVGLLCLGAASLHVVFNDLSDIFGRIVACGALAAAFFGVAWLYARWSRGRAG